MKKIFFLLFFTVSYISLYAQNKLELKQLYGEIGLVSSAIYAYQPRENITYNTGSGWPEPSGTVVAITGSINKVALKMRAMFVSDAYTGFDHGFEFSMLGGMHYTSRWISVNALLGFSMMRIKENLYYRYIETNWYPAIPTEVNFHFTPSRFNSIAFGFHGSFSSKHYNFGTQIKLGFGLFSK